MCKDTFKFERFCKFRIADTDGFCGLARDLKSCVFKERDHRRAVGDQARTNQPVRPIPGSDEHMRQEAEKTFAATGVYGLPNSGGYVLTKADKERLGLLY